MELVLNGSPSPTAATQPVLLFIDFNYNNISIEDQTLVKFCRCFSYLPRTIRWWFQARIDFWRGICMTSAKGIFNQLFILSVASSELLCGMTLSQESPTSTEGANGQRLARLVVASALDIDFRGFPFTTPTEKRGLY